MLKGRATNWRVNKVDMKGRSVNEELMKELDDARKATRMLRRALGGREESGDKTKKDRTEK